MRIIKHFLVNETPISELSNGARFDGLFDIPVIEKPSKIFIPDSLTPFSERTKVSFLDSAVCFYEKDENFMELLISPAAYLEELRQFQAVVSPDCSMYRDAPLSVQIINLYYNRLLGSYYQRNGIYVIPNIRWGSEDTYKISNLPEKVAFSGIEKNSIVSISSYGCIKDLENRYYFEAGLAAMMETLMPEVVLVYGAMPNEIFGQ